MSSYLATFVLPGSFNLYCEYFTGLEILKKAVSNQECKQVLSLDAPITSNKSEQ